MSDEKRALRRMAKKAALDSGMPLSIWLEANRLSRTVLYSGNRPSLAYIYRFCKAADMKPSEFFASMGK